MKVFIINPDNKELCSVEEWKKDVDPTRAKYIVLELDDGERRMYYKNKLRNEKGSERFTWADALKAAEGFREDGLDGWRIESRREALDCAGDAWDIFPEAVRLIGGDIVDGVFWTREIRSNSYNAWIFYGDYGYLHHSYRYNPYAVRVFRPF